MPACGQRPVDPTPAPFATHRAADPGELSTPDRFQAACTDHLSITLGDPQFDAVLIVEPTLITAKESIAVVSPKTSSAHRGHGQQVDGLVHTTQRDSQWKVDVDDQRPSLSDHDRFGFPALNPCSVSASMSPGAWSCPAGLPFDRGELGSARQWSTTRATRARGSASSRPR